MLNRRPKRRYLSIRHTGQSSDVIVSAISKRFAELFGSIAAERAAIRFVKSEGNTTVIRCRLNQLDNVLVAIAMADPPVVTLDMSGSIKRLGRQH
ncbi:MAG TPA: Rpp14/Pop5 family protein [Nitrososphaera sp.]|jgi:RNase P/RNase MRP subunit POP5